MKALSADTSPETERVFIEGIRKFPPWRKFQRVVELTEFIKGLALVEIRRQHPVASERGLKLRLVSRWMHADLMRKAFGWDIEKEGY